MAGNDNTCSSFVNKPNNKAEDLNERELALYIEALLDLQKTKYGDYKESTKQRKRAKREEAKLPLSITTQNKYSPLTEEMEVTEENQTIQTSSENQTQQTTSPAPENPVKTQQSVAPEKTQNASTNLTTVSQSKPKYKVPPIYLREKEKWLSASSLLKNNNIHPLKSQTTRKGIRIEPESDADYRKIRKLFEKNYQSFTYDLTSEKTLKVVLRGIITQITPEEVADDLEGKGYTTKKVSRMNGKNSQPAPLVLVQIGKEFKSIFNLKECCGLKITVESLKRRGDTVQCHKCQEFGHVQRNCFLPQKCMKCGEGHSTHLCEKPKTTLPKCANCQGSHLSTWLKCPTNPNNPENKKKFIPAPPPPTNIWEKRQTESQKNNTKTPEAHTVASEAPNDMMTVLSLMLRDFLKKDNTPEEESTFLNRIKQINALHEAALNSK